MSHKQPTRNVLNVFPDEDQGSEATYGFNYQAHCAARICIEMISDCNFSEIVCEHHEDIVQRRNGQPPIFCQIKKRESANTWTITLLKKAIQKLFEKLQYKNVGQLVIYGSGRPSSNDGCSLAGLITLLDRSESERDSDWNNDIKPYEDYFTNMFGSKIDHAIIQKGLRLLKIDLSMPNPEAIETENIKSIVAVISTVWGVEVTFQIAEQAYDALYKRIRKASQKPKCPQTMKSIPREQATTILRDILFANKIPLAQRPQDILDINTKLHKGELQDHTVYALQMRMDARQIKFEMGFESPEWQDFKDDIAEKWEEFYNGHLPLVGATLWKQLRELLKTTSEEWASKQNNSKLGPPFAEGVFFDMMAVCEADIGV